VIEKHAAATNFDKKQLLVLLCFVFLFGVLVVGGGGGLCVLWVALCLMCCSITDIPWPV
jgi:hypothetical protein